MKKTIFAAIISAITPPPEETPPKDGFLRFLKKHFFAVLIISFFVVLSSAYITGGDFVIEFEKVVGSAWLTSSSKDFMVSGTGVESIGAVSLSSKDYSINTYNWNAAASKLSLDLDNAHCYPNPFKPNSNVGHTNITFSRLTAHVKLKIIDVAGELVYSTEADTPMGILPWNVVNNSGQKVSSGVYIYLITDNAGHKKMGKFAVIR